MTCPVDQRASVRNEIVERLARVRAELATLTSGAYQAFEFEAAAEMASLADDIFWVENKLAVRGLEGKTT